MMYAIVNKTTGKVNSISSFNPENIKADEVIIDNFDVADINLFRFYIYNFDTKVFSYSNNGKFNDIRIKRNKLLFNSDYTQLDDSTYAGTKEEWKTYRQKLRDITKGVTDPDTIVFPEEPK